MIYDTLQVNFNQHRFGFYYVTQLPACLFPEFVLSASIRHVDPEYTNVLYTNPEYAISQQNTSHLSVKMLVYGAKRRSFSYRIKIRLFPYYKSGPMQDR